MSQHEPSRSFFYRNQFLIYRLFSLSGLIPVGAFLVVHLLTNASVLGGAGAFQSRVDMIHSLGPLLVPIEWEEPFGIVFAEALACGTPVISCPRGALPEIVDQGRHGFLVNSVEGGVAAVRRMGDISRAECRRRVEENFTIEIVAGKYLDLFQQEIELFSNKQ